MPDLAKPLQSSISQLVFSITSLNDLTKELLVKIEQGTLLKEAVHDLMVFPNDIPNSGGREAHLNRFLSMNFSQLLARNVMGASEETHPAEVEVVQ